MEKDEFENLPFALTIPQAAKILQVSTATLRRWIKAGHIKVVQKNRAGNYYIPRSEIMNANQEFYVPKTKEDFFKFKPERKTELEQREEEEEIAYLKSVGAYPVKKEDKNDSQS